MNKRVEEMLNKVQEVKKMFEQTGFTKGFEFVDQMNYMLTTYAGTEHEEQVIEDVQSSINQIMA